MFNIIYFYILYFVQYLLIKNYIFHYHFIPNTLTYSTPFLACFSDKNFDSIVLISLNP